MVIIMFIYILGSHTKLLLLWLNMEFIRFACLLNFTYYNLINFYLQILKKFRNATGVALLCGQNISWGTAEWFPFSRLITSSKEMSNPQMLSKSCVIRDTQIRGRAGLLCRIAWSKSNNYSHNNFAIWFLTLPHTMTFTLHQHQRSLAFSSIPRWKRGLEIIQLLKDMPKYSSCLDTNLSHGQFNHKFHF